MKNLLFSNSDFIDDNLYRVSINEKLKTSRLYYQYDNQKINPSNY